MICTIVGCGETAKDWHNTKHDLSIGVNDCFKFGHNVDHLVVVNHPQKFKNGRLETISTSKPSKFLTHAPFAWKKWFPKLEEIKTTPFYFKRLLKGKILESKTSPFVAISLAFNMGADDIILFGVDFINHQHYRLGGKYFSVEYDNYIRLFEMLQAQGVRIWRGTDGSCFDNDLNKWVSAQ
jgi:hypothetical protein